MKEPASWNHLPAGFGDQVIIRRTAETEAAGLADRTRIVHGVTTISVTGVPVVGKSEEDTAINVFFDESSEGVWYAPQLVKFVDHNPSTTITLSGVPKRWTRDDTVNWVESSQAISFAEWLARHRSILRRLLGR